MWFLPVRDQTKGKDLNFRLVKSQFLQVRLFGGRESQSDLSIKKRAWEGRGQTTDPNRWYADSSQLCHATISSKTSQKCSVFPDIPLTCHVWGYNRHAFLHYVCYALSRINLKSRFTNQRTNTTTILTKTPSILLWEINSSTVFRWFASLGLQIEWFGLVSSLVMWKFGWLGKSLWLVVAMR